MHIHTVYFWLRDDLTPAERVEFEEGLATLCADATVTTGYYGVPLRSRRAVVDSSFTYSLLLSFADTGKHDQYQVSPAHNKFVDENAHKWTRLQVYDTITS